MKTYNDLVAEFAEKYAERASAETNAPDEVQKRIIEHFTEAFIVMMQLPEAKALVQEVARKSVKNALHRIVEVLEYNQAWWQEFTKEKE
jgi:hypothetical protein